MKLAGDTMGSLKKYVHGIVSETRDFDTLSIEKEIGSNSRFFFLITKLKENILKMRQSLWRFNGSMPIQGKEWSGPKESVRTKMRRPVGSPQWTKTTDPFHFYATCPAMYVN